MPPRDRWQEDDVLPLRRVLALLGGAVLIAVALAAWADLATDGDEHEYRPSGAFPEATLGPRSFRAGVHEDLYDMGSRWRNARDADRTELESFGWTERERRIVSIPIEDAMKLYAGGARP